MEQEKYRPEKDYKHVTLDENGIPRITPTGMKVAELVKEKMNNKWSEARLHREHLFLSLAQIHSALAYYYDHKDEIDKYIKENLKVGSCS